ncbi:MAG: immunoglobulin domain-containing protein [Planctomycetes bacterium]|nr:immunoglobulin domain-containing protein [Planctomycetota bacterium]
MAFDSTRNRVVMFGGFEPNSSTYKNDTWEWTGINWLQRTATPSPTARMNFAMTFDSARGVCVIYGGTGNAGLLTDTWEWNGSTWSNRNASILPPPNKYHAIAFDSWRGRTFLFGGISTFGDYLSDTRLWDGESWTLCSPANRPPPRILHAMAFDSTRGVLVMFGGTSTSDMNDTWEWDGFDWQQRFPLHSPSARTTHSMTYDSLRHVVVLFGGTDAISNRSDTWEWDGLDWNERAPGSSPTARWAHSMAFDSHRNKTVLFGGADSTNGLQYLGDTWEWDGTEWIQRIPQTSPSPRFSHAMTFDSNHGVTVLQAGLGDTEQGATWHWDGVDWTKVGPSDSALKREWPAMAFDSLRGKSVLFGGQVLSGAFAITNDTLEWDGRSWTQKSPIISPSPRTNHAMSYDLDRGVAVLFGGYSHFGSATLRDTWERNGEYWTLRTPANSPISRSGHAMTFVSHQHATLLFGGGEGSGMNDTWLWDGKNWNELHTTHSPPPRVFHAACYDSKRQVVVLFGGSGDNDPYGIWGDTWEWDGVDWNQKLPTSSPSPRSRHAMAYDSSRDVVVLFGGLASGNATDVWEWDGSNWIQRTPVTPIESRYFHAMAFDYRRKLTILCGGNAGFGGSTHIETKGWDGVQWLNISTESDPPSRYGPAMVFDDAQDRVVMFGGRRIYDGVDRNYVSLNDTWELAPTGPSPTITQHPASPTVCQGSTISLRSTATGDGSLSYRWRKNGVPMTDDEDTFGTQTPTLAFTHAAASDAGTYDCLVKLNDCTQATSNTATLSVFPTNTADGNLDGHTDARDIAVFVDALVNFAPVSAPLCANDLTGEGIVNPDDIPPFVTRLLAE